MGIAYWNPGERVIGNGCFARLPHFIQSLNGQSILLVLGQKSFRYSPHFQKLLAMLEGYELIETLPIPANPTQSFLQQEIDRLKEAHYDLVLAIGGGSVLDSAKLLASIPRQNPSDLQFYIDKKVEIYEGPAPLIAVPTTSGTGSEVTPYASLETNDKKKITLNHPSFYPAVALIDPELTHTMPAYVTASTGFDALSQAIESYWSIHSTPFSETHALRALELIVPNLEKVLVDPLNSEARFALALASCEAGLAIAQTKTTAVHSVSYPITSHFGVAHGHACALTLAEFVRFNAPVLKEKGKALMLRFGVQDYEPMASKIETLMQAVGLERSLGKLGIDEEGHKLILQDGFRPDRVKNNPRPLTPEDLKGILYAIR